MPGLSEYQMPSYLQKLSSGDGDRRSFDTLSLGRLKEYLETGRNFIQNESSYRDVPEALQILCGGGNVKFNGYSDVSINRIKHDFRTVVATVSNLRPTGLALTKRKEEEASVDRLNKMKQHWWMTTFQDRKYREQVQWVVALGTGYMEPWFDPNFYGYYRGEIATKTHGPGAVFPVMLTEDGDLQKAYAVTICEQVPLHIVLANYPQYAHAIQPSRSSWIGRVWDRVRGQPQPTNGVMGVLATPQMSLGRDMPVVEVNTTYIMDMQTNGTGQVIPMGVPGSSWEYKVPYLGQEIPTGIRDLQGRQVMKRAREEDCMLFPLRRRIIWIDGQAVLSDGTSPQLHGRVPLVKLRFDDFPWDFTGQSIVKDTARLQKARNQIIRAVIDSVLVRLQPPLAYDPNIIDPALMARINTRIPGQTIQTAMAMGDPVKPLLPLGHWDVPQWIMQMITMLGEEMDNLALVKDLTAIAKAKQVPSADSIEKLLEMAGPVVQDICRAGEKATCEFDALWYPMAMQFWDASKVFHVLGEDGAVKEWLDMDPGNLIPSHLPGEDRKQPSVFDTWQRTRWAIEQQSYTVEPFSQAQVSRIGRNLVLLQAKKAGIPVSDNTIGKGLGLNMGELPPMRDGKSPVTEPEKWEVESEWKAAIAEDIAGGAGAGAPKPGRGRPNSNQTPPHVKSKDGGTRTTIATSR